MFCPKYRRKVLTGAIAERLKAIIHEVAAELECEIMELETRPDHVHIVCEVPPHHGIAKFVRFFNCQHFGHIAHLFRRSAVRRFLSSSNTFRTNRVRSHVRRKMLKALRYRLYPTKAQASQLAWTLETCRQVYNSLVNDRKFQYEVNGKAPTWIEQKRSITAWKPAHPELSDVYSQVLQDVSKRVDLAFQAFFRRVKAGETAGYHRVKGDGYDSFTYPQAGFGLHQGKLHLSKIGDIAVRLHRRVDSDIKTCTVRRINYKWFVCFSSEYEPEPLPPSAEEVGIDVGLKTFASLSNGENIENPRFFRAEEKALAKAQRKLAKAKNEKHKRWNREKKKPAKLSPLSMSGFAIVAMISCIKPRGGWSTALASLPLKNSTSKAWSRTIASPNLFLMLLGLCSVLS